MPQHMMFYQHASNRIRDARQILLGYHNQSMKTLLNNVKNIFATYLSNLSSSSSDIESNSSMQPSFRIDPCQNMLGRNALEYIIDNCDFNSVIDIGCGLGMHADILESKGKVVTRFDQGQSRAYKHNDKTIIANFLSYDFDRQFDLVWACHVLEHQLDPNKFLIKIRNVCKPHGIIAITVPPAKPEFVGGHLTLWTPALLLYHLVLAGIDCKNAFTMSYGYNISVIVANEPARYSIEDLRFDFDDINRLSQFLPDSASPKCRGDLIGSLDESAISFWKK
jgi:2-polyprenyl-3-methyl-5-hydroxy-6-metoxy-1,4-benzoquinol methylase